MNDIVEHLAQFPPAQRRALTAIRTHLLRLLPGASETIAWRMPSYRIDGDLVISFDGFAQHNSLFPGAEAIRTLSAALADYSTTKGTIHLPRDVPPPVTLLRELVRTRIDEINASYPRSSGVTKVFYDNGRLKSRGRIRGGVMTGDWEFYRRDGSLMRSGSLWALGQRTPKVPAPRRHRGRGSPVGPWVVKGLPEVPGPKSG